MKTRVLAAIPLVLCLLGAIFIQSWFLIAFLIFMSIMSQYELTKAFNNNGTCVFKTLGISYPIVLSILFILNNAMPETHLYSLINIAIVSGIYILLSFIFTILSKKHDVVWGINTIFTFVYPQFFFILLYSLFKRVTGFEPFCNEYWHTFMLALWLFLPANFTDTFAYLIGRSFGKTKLAPEISPNKTVSGSIGGIVGGVICGIILGLLGTYLISDYLPIAVSIIIGAVIGVLAQFGDLSASLIKRKLDVKDFGKLIPGHGGVLDRIDSIIFCVPLIFICNVFNWL